LLTFVFECRTRIYRYDVQLEWCVDMFMTNSLSFIFFLFVCSCRRFSTTRIHVEHQQQDNIRCSAMYMDMCQSTSVHVWTLLMNHSSSIVLTLHDKQYDLPSNSSIDSLELTTIHFSLEYSWHVWLLSLSTQLRTSVSRAIVRHTHRVHMSIVVELNVHIVFVINHETRSFSVYMWTTRSNIVVTRHCTRMFSSRSYIRFDSLTNSYERSCTSCTRRLESREEEEKSSAVEHTDDTSIGWWWCLTGHIRIVCGQKPTR
jgi:hypothetical protein